jgi:redox-sensitive bicupin YhaK (pirin superfamily)
MVVLRRAQERRHTRRRGREVWQTFDSKGFGALAIFNEEHLSPGAGSLRRPHRDADSLTYVREGALAYQEATGDSGVINVGEFHRLSVGRGVRRNETNLSPRDATQVFTIGLFPSAVRLDPRSQQKRFSVADRRYGLCLVGSPDGRRGSLLLHLDVELYSAILDPGQHVVHELLPGRSAWLQLLQGEGTVGDVVLTTGDGVGISGERALSLTAREESEILLFDLGPPRQPPVPPS